MFDFDVRIERDIKNCTATVRSDSYLKLRLEVDNEELLISILRQDDLIFPIVSCPVICSNIPQLTFPMVVSLKS